MERNQKEGKNGRRGGGLTVYAVHFVAVDEFTTGAGEGLAGFRVGGQSGEFGAGAGAAEGEEGAEMGMLAFELGEGGETAFFAVDFDGVVGPVI